MRKLVVLFVALAASGTASAETYLGVGLGTAADMNNDNSGVVTTQGNGRSGRLMLGMRFGRLSVEGTAGRYGLFLMNYPADSTQFSAALKYSFPLGDNFELFGRGGIERASLSEHDANIGMSYDASGTGYLLGGGIEYRLNMLVGGGSLFVDYERTSTSFTNNEMTKFDATSGMWTAGVTLAL